MARNQHRLFIVFLVYTCFIMLLFVYMSCQYFLLIYPDLATVADVFAMAFSDSPAIFLLGVCNTVSALWLISLTMFQIDIVSKNMTTAYRPNRGRSALTRRQRFINVVRFFLSQPAIEETGSVQA